MTTTIHRSLTPQCGFLWRVIDKGINDIEKSMGANNRRIRRLIVDLLWEYGAMTKDRMAVLLSEQKSIRVVPSPHTLSSLLAKNTQVVQVGKERVENAIGVKSYHALYDINRDLIKFSEDIILTRTPSVATPKEKERMSKCPQCGRNRILPTDSEVCLHCVREQ